jgi:hypothetical protein
LSLPPGWDYLRYHNVFTGEMVSIVEAEDGLRLGIEEVFASFPLALLEATENVTG